LFRYGAGACFGAVVEVPTSRYRIETEGGRPYVATSLEIDRGILAGLIAELPPAAVAEQAPGFGVAAASLELLQAWDHYLALLDTPADLPILAAQRERELLYRLLQSTHGPMLRQVVREDTPLARIRRVIDWIMPHFNKALPTSGLAEIAGMSVPSLHRHFRAATTMSPLQFQKMLRLQAARNLLATNADATTAAYAVGYESPSQFGREYSRLFGRPPARDATYLRGNPAQIASSAM
jgi:AraC-like DNA-binding protein